MQWGDLITLEYGKPVKDKECTDGAVPVYGTNGQIGTSHFPPLCKHPSFILGRKGAYRGVHYSEVPFSVIDTAFFAEPISDKIDLKWAYYKFLTYDINRMDSGSAIPSTDRYEIYAIEVELPDLTMQRRVVAVLESIDKKINVNKAVNDNLQQQVATIFHQWFVANPESEKWPLVTLDSLTSLVSRGIAPKYTDDSVQIVLNQKCIRDHYIDISLARRHNPKVINEKWLQYGDLLINSTGEGTLGRAAQVWFVPDNMTVDSHVTIVRPKGPHLLFYIGLWGISHEREIEALHTGSTGQTELPRERVKAMELRLPDNDTLARFNVVIAPIVSLIITNQQENVRLSSIRDALLPKLMSGEIDVSDIQL